MTPIETRIVQHSWRFDPISLLMLLDYLGYGMDEILFCSHFSNCSQTRLVEGIKFHESPRKVVITLNIGLLGGQSVLPNYLFKQVDNGSVDSELFAKFFGYFDDQLLRRFLFAIYSEFDQTFTQSWESRKNASLYTLKLDSITTLHWLTQLVFPELQVRVEKRTLKRNITLNSPILGKCHLSHQTVFGKRKEMLVPGKYITLITDEENFTNGQPWVHEINNRLQNLIFPLLRNVGVDLEIWLVIQTQGSALSLKQNSYLGYENIFSDKLQVRRIRIFSGYLCD
jgi:hypothetical protein